MVLSHAYNFLPTEEDRHLMDWFGEAVDWKVCLILTCVLWQCVSDRTIVSIGTHFYRKAVFAWGIRKKRNLVYTCSIMYLLGNRLSLPFQMHVRNCLMLTGLEYNVQGEVICIPFSMSIPGCFFVWLKIFFKLPPGLHVLELPYCIYTIFSNWCIFTAY